MLFLKPSKFALELKESGKYPPDTLFLDIRKGSKGQLRATSSNIVLIEHRTYMIELEKNSNEIKATNEKFILYSTDDNQTFYQELTIEDNLRPNSDKILLEFIDIKKDLNYTLKIISDLDEEERFVFIDIPYKELTENDKSD